MLPDRPSALPRVPDPLGWFGSLPVGSKTPQCGAPLDKERTVQILVASESLSDTTLLARCAEGDEDSWRLLVRRYKNLVYSTALEIGLGSEDAQDVFQEVWLELHRSIPRIRNPQALPRWLIVATRRLSFKVATRRRRMVPGVSRDLIDPGTLPDREVEDRSTLVRLEAALETISEKCAHLLRLLFFEPEKMRYDEISKRTGLAIGSIGPIRARCLARLRRALEDGS